MATLKKDWPGAVYRCSECGQEKFVITNTYLPEIWEQCSELCCWSAFGEKGPSIPTTDGRLGFYHRRRFRITEYTNEKRG